jgi:heme exporter protein A
LLRILATLLKPSAGSARVAGHDIVREPDAVRDHVAFLGHTPGLYDDLTARENLRFAADMRGIRRAPLDTLLDRVSLLYVADSRTRGFSAGMKQRLALARLMLGRPKVLLLDEPYSNLDSGGVALMNEVIGEVRGSGGATFMALHELAPAAPVLHRTLALAQGRIATESAASVR